MDGLCHVPGCKLLFFYWLSSFNFGITFMFFELFMPIGNTKHEIYFKTTNKCWIPVIDASFFVIYVHLWNICCKLYNLYPNEN